MWGKWHLGDEPEHAPENQGYDYAYYGLWNGAPDNWPASFEMYRNGPNSHRAMFYDFPGADEYEKRTGIDLSVAGYVGRKGQERTPIEGAAGALGPDRQEAFETESIAQITDYIQEHAKAEEPFFIYWATYTQQLQGSQAHHGDEDVDKVNAQASAMAAHNAHVRQLLDTLKTEGIAENTLVVWISDNGPMYAFFPNSGYSWLRGGKGDVLEGGVRVPAMATDLFTTAARLGGALDKIPRDRVTDGVDQTALLLLGEDHGRRNVMFHYSGGVLGAIRYEDFKVHLKAGHGGLPGMDFYNVMRDPGEKFGQLYPGLFAVTPIQMLLKGHMLTIRKFPNRTSETVPRGAELTPHD
jgi:arylsulfatase